MNIFDFLNDERGSATIEFVLWVPVFVVLLIATVDASVLYLQHTEMWNVSRDVARRVTVGDLEYDKIDEAVKTKLFLASKNYILEISDPAELDVTVKLQTSIKDASVFGFFKPVLGRYLTAEVTMRKEPY